MELPLDETKRPYGVTTSENLHFETWKIQQNLKRTSSSNHPPSWLQVPAIIFPGCTKLDWLQTPWLIYIIFQWQPFCSPDWWFRIGEILAEGDLNFRNHLCKWPKDAGKLMTCGKASKFESCLWFWSHTSSNTYQALPTKKRLKDLTGAETWGLWTKDPGPRGVPGLVMYEHGVMFIGPRGRLETPQASSCFAMMNGNSLKFAETGNSSSISDIAFFF